MLIRPLSRRCAVVEYVVGRASAKRLMTSFGVEIAIALANNAVHESLHAMGSVHNRQAFNVMNGTRVIADVERRRQYIIKTDREVVNTFLGRK